MLRECPARLCYRSFRWLIVWLLVGLSGCASRELSYPTGSRLPFSDSGKVVVPNRWWTVFDDPGLNHHVDQALGGSFPLATSLQRLRAARALTRREASSLFADVNGFVDFDSTLGDGPDRTNTVWGLDAAYQVDLWGQIQSRVDAERLRAEATHADYHAVSLSLAAEVARTWFSLVEGHAQLKLIAEQTETNRTGLKALELRFGTGIIRSPDVLRQQQLVESTLEQAVLVGARIEVLEHQLAVLLGEVPQAASYTPGAELPGLPPLPATGLPSELVARRPDVRRDYLAFVAADRDLAAAISDQYPRLDLTSSLINVAETPGPVLGDWFFSVGGQLIAPLLDGGQRRAEIDRTAAVAEQRLNEYEQTRLIAFREVEDALALERFQIERIKRLEAQIIPAELAFQQLREQYLISEDNFLDVLSAIQSQQRLQRAVLSARLDLILTRIGLYLALAGDFDTRPQAFSDPPLSDLPLDELELPSGFEELPPVRFAPEIDFDE